MYGSFFLNITFKTETGFWHLKRMSTMALREPRLLEEIHSFLMPPGEACN